MGQIIFPPKAKLIFGILAADEKLLSSAKNILEKNYGNIDLESDISQFSFTDFYCDEMGENILRQYISFKLIIDQENINDIKVKTNDLEKEFIIDEKRQVNLDPGFVTLDKMLLATTKPANYRIYLGKGIYAQSTIYFKNKSFQPWEWTYPDYKDPKTIAFFNGVRKIYKEQIK